MPEVAFRLLPEVRARMKRQLVADCNFLRKMKIMDYSMLLGVHHIPPKGAQVRQPGLGIAYTGLSFRDPNANARGNDGQFSRRSHTRSKSVPSLGAKSTEDQNFFSSSLRPRESLDSFNTFGKKDEQAPDGTNPPRLGAVPWTKSSPLNKQENAFQKGPGGQITMTYREASDLSRGSVGMQVSPNKIFRPTMSGTPETPASAKSTYFTPGESIASLPETPSGRGSKSRGVSSGASIQTTQSPSKKSFPSLNSHSLEANRSETGFPQRGSLATGSRGGFSSKKSYRSTGSQANDGTIDLSVSSFGTFDHFLDDDDGFSYLEGARNQKTIDKTRYHVPTDLSVEVSHHQNGVQIHYDEVELKKLRAVERIYWPFHRFFDIHGRRRMQPVPYFENHVSAEEARNDYPGWAVPKFIAPLSNRKDGGHVLDSTGLNLPLKFIGNKGTVQYYEGKIFYMGIIDILQQFNIRKRLEARYRRMLGGGWADASCVHPNLYAERFLRFYDEYTQMLHKEQEDENDNDDNDSDNVEQIEFFSEEKTEEEEKHELF